jgi:hypothetical protein
VIRRALAVAAVVLGAGPVLAVPTLPDDIRVVPVYATPPAIRVSWIELPIDDNALYYNIHKRVGTTGPDVAVGVVVAAEEGLLSEFLDPDVVPGTSYRYRLEACDETGCVSDAGFATTVDTVWPISGGRRVVNGFNENLGWAGLRGEDLAPVGFHDGVDLGRTTVDPAAADAVHAPRGGIVRRIEKEDPPTVDDDFIEIVVDMGGGHFEFDGFNHIASGTLPVMEGDVVRPGQMIATIGTRHFNGSEPDHVHFQLAARGTRRPTVRHPLSVFRDDADRDPGGHAPKLNDENRDQRTALYFDHTNGQLIPYDRDTHPLRGDVDVAAEVMDQQGTQPHQAPIRLGYWIEGPLPAAEHLDDVKSAANPYRLYDYRTEYWGLAPATACDLISSVHDPANAGCPTLGCVGTSNVGCAATLPGHTVAWPWPILHHFVVTHAGTETAARTGLSKNQFWRTAAKDDGGPVVSSHANYANQPTTTKAWEARFPDGDYTVHLLASDLVHTDIDLPLPPTRLENFAPFILEVLVTVDADGNPGTGHPDTPNCEAEAYHYQHAARRQYPDRTPLAVARAAAAEKIIRAGRQVCVQVRFSEPMSTAAIELVGQRGAGATVAAPQSTLVKTHQDNDTVYALVTLTADPSGGKDSSVANDEKDIAIRVTGQDRRDGANVRRSLDTDGDGVANAAADVNHLVKIDLSPMKKALQVDKTAVRP